MKLVHIRAIITALATLFAIQFLILAYRHPESASLILTIELVLVPSIYIIGNYYAEQKIQDQNSADMDNILDATTQLKEDYLNEKHRRKLVELELRWIKRGKN